MHSTRVSYSLFLVLQSRETVSKDATNKELETKLEALRQHSTIQEDLVMNLLQPNNDNPLITTKDPKDPEALMNEGPGLMNGITDDIVPFMVSVVSFILSLYEAICLVNMYLNLPVILAWSYYLYSTEKDVYYHHFLDINKLCHVNS